MLPATNFMFIETCIKRPLINKLNKDLKDKWKLNAGTVILPVHSASFTHNFVSGMQSFYFSESQDALVLQTCHEK